MKLHLILNVDADAWAATYGEDPGQVAAAVTGYFDQSLIDGTPHADLVTVLDTYQVDAPDLALVGDGVLVSLVVELELDRLKWADRYGLVPDEATVTADVLAYFQNAILAASAPVRANTVVVAQLRELTAAPPTHDTQGG